MQFTLIMHVTIYGLHISDIYYDSDLIIRVCVCVCLGICLYVTDFVGLSLWYFEKMN